MAVDANQMAAAMLQAAPPGQVPGMPPGPPPPLPEPAVAMPPGPPITGAPLQPETGPMPGQPAQMVQGGMPAPQAPGAPPQEQEPMLLVPQPMKEALARKLLESKMAIAQGIVVAYGQPEGTVSVNDQQLLKLWRYRNPEVDVAHQRAMGTPEHELVDMVYPLRRMLLNTGNFTWREKVKFAQRMARMNADDNAAYPGPIEYDPKKVPVGVK